MINRTQIEAGLTQLSGTYILIVSDRDADEQGCVISPLESHEVSVALITFLLDRCGGLDELLDLVIRVDELSIQ